jgi:hypothetical protein
MGNKIDITSTAIEKGIDLAKDFLDKLIIPAVEETGLLLKDKVTLWKFKNQVRILNKAKDYCEKNNISSKIISLKLLCPLLDNAALEEEEELQNKWAILLSNLVDSDQNIENHVFPYILGQISINEFLFLEKVFNDKNERVMELSQRLEAIRKEKPELEKPLQLEVDLIDQQIEKIKVKGKHSFSIEIWDLQKVKREKERKLTSLKYKESGILRKISEPEIILESELRAFELSNLTRLGLVKPTQETYANKQTLEIPKYNECDQEKYIRVDVDIEFNFECIMTELGELFIDAYTHKRIKVPNNTFTQCPSGHFAKPKRLATTII